MPQMFRFIPQITFCCCCTNCSLRTGALVVGWLGVTIFAVPEMILIVLVGTVIKGSPYYVERICAVACVTLEFDVLHRAADVPAWLGLMDLAVAVSYCSVVLIMSVILLIGLYEKRIILVKLWLEVIMVVWAVGVVYSSSRIVLVFVFGHGNVWEDFVSSIIHIFVIPGVPLYCIVVVKSYYVEECKSLLRDAIYGKRDFKTMRPTPSTDLGYILRRIPQVWYTCCCTSYTLRLGVLTFGWCSIIGLASYILTITVFITELLIAGHGHQIPEWSFYGQSSFISACIDVSFSWTLVIFLLITSVILLIGLKNGNLKVIKILLGIHVEMWFVFLVVQIMCYVATSMIFFPRFFIMASFKIVIIQVVYGYWIVMIKSYYVVEYVRQKHGQRIDEVSEISVMGSLRKKSQYGTSKSTLTLARSDTFFTKSEMEFPRTGSVPQIQSNQENIKEVNRKEHGKERTPLFGRKSKESKSEPRDDEQITQMKAENMKRRSTTQTVKKQKTAFNIQEEQELEGKKGRKEKQTVQNEKESDRKKSRPDSPEQVLQREKRVEPGTQQDKAPSKWQLWPQREITVEPDKSENSPQRVKRSGETVEPDGKKPRSQSPQQVQQREKTVEPDRKQGEDKVPSKWQLWPQREKTVEPDTKQLGRETTSQVRETPQKKIEPDKKELDQQSKKSRSSPDEPKKSKGRSKTPHKEI